MANNFEDKVAALFKEEGWEVLRSGWPDMLCVRPRANGGFDLVGVEVKAKGDKLRPNQKRNLAALSTVMPVRVVEQGPGFGSKEIPNEASKGVACLVYNLERYENEGGKL